MPISNKQLVKYARGQLGRPYWYSCYGQISSVMVYNIIAGRYPDKVKKWPKESYMAQLGQKVHDCSGLIKAAIFCKGDPEALPQYNCKYDYSADGLINLCTETGSFDSVPDVPGLILWKPGHVGVLIDRKNGPHWVEAKGHNYGVVECTTGTAWQKWGKLPASWITYEDIPAPDPDPKGGKYDVKVETLKKGSKGPNVFLLQSFLKGKGYKGKNNKVLELDSSMGGNTCYAFGNWQEASGLTRDEICGPKSWDKIANG